MLPVNIDNLSAYLKPPLGYRFDKGFTTTYSLHLDILLTMPMFLDGRLSEENAVIENYAGVVAAIKSFKDKFKVYVQKGEIQTSSLASKKASKLYELLRPMIQEIHKDTTKSSFHPKLWLLRYESENGKSKKYRLIVLSKNLTNSKDLDIAVVFDGTIQEESKHKEINENIFYFCKNILEDDTFSEEELKQVIWDNIDDYSLENFYVLPKDKNKLPFVSKRKINDKTIVFSPFVSNDVLTEKSILVTREEEIKEQVCKNMYTINSSLIEKEELLPQKLEMFEKEKNVSNKVFIHQLHAKIYVYKKNHKNWLTFGSANATHRGLSKNDEILVELKAPRGFYENTKNYIETNKFFVELEVQDKVDDSQDNSQKILDELDDIKRKILNLKIKLEYKDEKLVLKSTMEELEEGIKIEVTPSSRISFQHFKEKLFWKVEESEITGWFRFRLSKEGESREFLFNDEDFEIQEDYVKNVEKEASEKSLDYLKANIFALLNDGNITKSKMRESIKEDISDGMHNYCSKRVDTHEYIYDLMLDKYAMNVSEYNTLLGLFEKVDEYKSLLDVLQKAEV